MRTKVKILQPNGLHMQTVFFHWNVVSKQKTAQIFLWVQFYGWRLLGRDGNRNQRDYFFHTSLCCISVLLLSVILGISVLEHHGNFSWLAFCWYSVLAGYLCWCVYNSLNAGKAFCNLSLFCLTAFAGVCIRGGTMSVGPKVRSLSALVRRRTCRRKRSKGLVFFKEFLYRLNLISISRNHATNVVHPGKCPADKNDAREARAVMQGWKHWFIFLHCMHCIGWKSGLSGFRFHSANRLSGRLSQKVKSPPSMLCVKDVYQGWKKSWFLIKKIEKIRFFDFLKFFCIFQCCCALLLH